jgi:hypothetical protein
MYPATHDRPNAIAVGQSATETRREIGIFLAMAFGFAWLLWGYWVVAMPPGGLVIGADRIATSLRGIGPLFLSPRKAPKKGPHVRRMRANGSDHQRSPLVPKVPMIMGFLNRARIFANRPLVPWRRLELPRLASHGPEPCASTNSATRAPMGAVP